MKKLNSKEIAIPSFSLFLICMIVTALLAGTNLLTKDTIADQNAQKEENSRKVVLSQAESFSEATLDGMTYYIGKDADGNKVGYVFTTSAKGYGGEIKVMTGISTDSSVQGVVILSQDETPGLGANATKEDFRGQYQQSVPLNGFSVVKNTPQEGEIEAMTGATISSKAVTDAVNQAVEAYQSIQGGSN